MSEVENIEQTEVEQIQQPEETSTDDVNVEQTSTEEPAVLEEESGEEVVSFGDEVPPTDEQQTAPAWVKELRKQHRELQKQNRELQEKLQAQSAPPAITLGPKPTMEDYVFDADKYEEALAQWYEKKNVIDQQEAAKQQQEQAAQQEFMQKVQSYQKAKAALKFADVEEAEETAGEHLDVTQRGVLVAHAENPALLVYALGKNPQKLKELSAIKDPVKFGYQLAKMETQLKVTTRKPPAPEASVKSSGGTPISGSVDSTLERLRAEAEKTGDYSKVFQYKQAKRNK